MLLGEMSVGGGRLWTRTLDKKTRVDLPESLISRMSELPTKATKGARLWTRILDEETRVDLPESVFSILSDPLLEIRQ